MRERERWRTGERGRDNEQVRKKGEKERSREVAIKTENSEEREGRRKGEE